MRIKSLLLPLFGICLLAMSCGGGGGGGGAVEVGSTPCTGAACGTASPAKPPTGPVAVQPPAGVRGDIPIVYSWSERTLEAADVKGIRVTALDNYDPLPDSALVFAGFKEANVVDRDADGTERTLFDCIGNDALHCAALDPRVSPDNRRIAFAVVYARAVVAERWTIHGVLPIKSLDDPVAAQIFVYHVDTRELKAWPRVDGVMDMHPEWISNDRLVFVSNRTQTYPVRVQGKSPSYGRNRALQRWTADVDGGAATLIGPHDDMALHPLVLSDGNIVTATWRVDEVLGAGNVALENQYWMTMTDQFGAGEVSLLGAHGTAFTEGGSANALLSLHFYGERSNGDLMTANYYRANHMSLGLPVAFPRLPHGVEGVGANFLPAIYALLPWAQEEDNPTHRDAAGKFMGKGGHPSGLPGGQVLLTKGTGYCYTGLPLAQANAEFLQGPGCDTGIYVLGKVPSTHPSDLVKVVDRPDRHEFSADVRMPYSAVYGKPAPEVQRRKDQGFCSLQVVNARLGALHAGDKSCTRKASCILPGYKIADLDRLAIYEALPNTVPQTTLETPYLEGHEMRLLGYARPAADGSINVRIPCDVPYKVRGVAADGVEFIRDQVKHSNRPGEARQCLGCHAGHTMGDHRDDTPAQFARSIAGRAPAVALQAK